MEYYAVLNMFNSSTPELTTRYFTTRQDADSIWQPSKELAIQMAHRTLYTMLAGKMDTIKWALANEFKGDSLEAASQITIYSLKLTALVHLAISTDLE